MNYDIDIIVSTTLLTVEKLAKHKNGGDAILLYFKYIRQSRIQKSEESHSNDKFMMQGLGWSSGRFKKAKKILTDMNLVEIIKVRNGGKFDKFLIKAKFVIQSTKAELEELKEEIEKNHSVEKPLGGKTTGSKNHPVVKPLSGKSVTNNNLVYEKKEYLEKERKNISSNEEIGKAGIDSKKNELKNKLKRIASGDFTINEEIPPHSALPSLQEDGEIMMSRKMEVDEMIAVVKDSVIRLGLVYKPGKMERQRAWNLLTAKEFGEFCIQFDIDRAKCVEAIIKASHSSGFRFGKINNCETVYSNYAKVYNDHVSRKKATSTSSIQKI